MNVTIAGCGRWGSFITWYLDRIGHQTTLYGRKSSKRMQAFLETRKNDLLELPPSVTLSTDLHSLCGAEVIVVSMGAQNFRGFLKELAPLDLRGKIFVLCMKGIEDGSGKRLSEIAEEHGISRQGVHDTVKRCSEKLADYEAKLKLVDKFMKIRKDISEIEKQAGMLKSGETEAGEAADRIAVLAGQILEEI